MWWFQPSAQPPSVEDLGPFVVHLVWPLPCNQSGMVRPAGLLQNGVVYHRLFSIRPVLRSNTSQSLLGSTCLQIKASHYPTGCRVVISTCEAAMCLQAAGHILGGFCAQLRWESVWTSRNVVMEIAAEHMIVPTSAVMLGPTGNNFAHACTHKGPHMHTRVCTCTYLYMVLLCPLCHKTQIYLTSNDLVIFYNWVDKATIWHLCSIIKLYQVLQHDDYRAVTMVWYLAVWP